MKAHTVFLAALLLGALLLLGLGSRRTGTVTASVGPGPNVPLPSAAKGVPVSGVRSDEPLAPAGAPALSGGVYRLASSCADAGVSKGGGYRLVPEVPAGYASGCCCAYLPLAIRHD